MGSLLRLAKRVEFFGDVTNFRPCLFISIRKREGIEYLRLRVARVVANTQPGSRSKGPHNMDAGREYTEVKRVVGRDTYHHVVRHDAAVNKLEMAMLRCFCCRKCSGEAR